MPLRVDNPEAIETLNAKPTGFGWVDALYNSMAKDSFGGLSPGSAIVTNPAHRSFQNLMKAAPKVAEALQRMALKVRYTSKEPPGMFLESQGLFTKPVNPETPAEIFINPKLKDAKERGITNIHEALHALYFNKDPWKRTGLPYPELRSTLGFGEKLDPTTVPALTRFTHKFNNPNFPSPYYGADVLTAANQGHAIGKSEDWALSPHGIIEALAQSLYRRNK